MLSSDRRKFLLQTMGAAVYSAPAIGFVAYACKTVRDSSQLKDGEPPVGYAQRLTKAPSTLRLSATDPANWKNIDLYRKAIAKMKATEFPHKINDETVTWWEAHAQIHNNSCPHGNWFFLPWHRAYLHYYERVIRVFCEDDTFALPYWDWTSDAKIPSMFLEGDEAGNALFNKTRRTTDLVRVKDCKQDRIDGIIDTADFATFGGGSADRPRIIDDTIKDELEGSHGTLEGGPHNRVHATIQGDMGMFVSPRDPIFWLHHCNIDRLWNAWTTTRKVKSQDPLPATPAPDAPDARLTRDYWMNYKVDGFYSAKKVGDTYEATPASYRIGDLVDAEDMGLAYSVPPRVEVPAPTPQPTPTPTPVPKAPESIQEPTVPAPTPIPSPIAAVPAPGEPEVVPLPVVDSPKTEAPVVAPVKEEPKLVNETKEVIEVKTETQQPSGAALSLASVPKNIITLKVKGSERLDTVLRNSAKERGNKEVTLRMTISEIPFAKDPASELEFYMNSTKSTDNSDSPEYIGSMSFFGHAHEGKRVAMSFDLVPVVKSLAAAGKAPYGQAKLLTVKAVWKNNSKPEDLSDLSLKIAYLEFR